MRACVFCTCVCAHVYARPCALGMLAHAATNILTFAPRGLHLSAQTPLRFVRNPHNNCR